MSDLAEQNRTTPVHPAWLRLTHGVNAIVVVAMASSGWRIYNAAPQLSLRFPSGLALGGWLGGALQWHFAVMWVLVANGALYLAVNLSSGRFARRLLPLTPATVWHDLWAALCGRLQHADPRDYNALQRLAYLGAVALLVTLVLSGAAIWKPVQLSWLCGTLGGYESARRIHLLAMALLMAFAVAHVVMVALVPKTLLPMIRGR